LLQSGNDVTRVDGGRKGPKQMCEGQDGEEADEQTVLSKSCVGSESTLSLEQNLDWEGRWGLRNEQDPHLWVS